MYLILSLLPLLSTVIEGLMIQTLHTAVVTTASMPHKLELSLRSILSLR